MSLLTDTLRTISGIVHRKGGIDEDTHLGICQICDEADADSAKSLDLRLTVGAVLDEPSGDHEANR